MGLCSSSNIDKAELQYNKSLEKTLEIDAKNRDDVVKLLLLGAGESGIVFSLLLSKFSSSFILQKIKSRKVHNFQTNEDFVWGRIFS